MMYKGLCNGWCTEDCVMDDGLRGLRVNETILKLDCPIILLRNLNWHEGLCNGTRMVVTAMAERVIEAQILTGTHAGRKAFIPWISLDTSMSSGLGFILRRRQLPIRLAFGMSINKAQGQSLNRVGIYLNNPVFAHGQLYIALSRCTDCHNLRILLPPNSNRRMSNIVYREVIEWVHRKVLHNNVLTMMSLMISLLIITALKISYSTPWLWQNHTSLYCNKIIHHYIVMCYNRITHHNIW